MVRPTADIGVSIPLDTSHAVSVSLPTWRANVGYEEGEDWVLSKMKTGYPRFFIHLSIQKLAASVVSQFGRPGQNEAAMLVPSLAVANRCRQFIKQTSPSSTPPSPRVLELSSTLPQEQSCITSDLYAVLYPASEFPTAKQFWQHSGDGISSRRAEFCQRELDAGLLVEKTEEMHRQPKGPKRYSKVTKGKGTPCTSMASEDVAEFVEARFGRNLDHSQVGLAKTAIRRRIGGMLEADVNPADAVKLPTREDTRSVSGLSEDDVYLYPCGMSAIFNAHRTLLAALGQRKSVSFGFPYVDTLKILQKFGPGCHFYGHGSDADLDDLEGKLTGGERILALFCEFPSNPLLQSPNLNRIRQLADKFDFAVVVDETIGNFRNIQVLPQVDVIVSSLTKIFSGDSNVMGGSMVLNPTRRYYRQLKEVMGSAGGYEDNYWAEDALVMERNSRDFVSRIERINTNAEAVCEVLMSHPKVKAIFYPKYSETRPNYDAFRCPNGGYGGLVSVTFHEEKDAETFFDRLDTAKGPSLGTNFTLTSPYVLLAHYAELDWVRGFGVEPHLLRFSVGLEETGELVRTFQDALVALD